METYVYICSWNNFGGEPGIGRYKFDAASGELSFMDMCNKADSCNATCFDKKRRILYVSNEVSGQKELRGNGGGRIFVYSAEENGQLTKIDEVSTFCPNPAYMALNADSSRMLVANYSGFAAASKIQKDAFGKYHLEIVYDDAAVELFEILPNGRIGELKDVAMHTGSGPCAQQTHPRPHCVVRSPSGKLYAVCDKGNDCVYMYTVHKDSLKLCALPFQDTPGSMPRYCVFHPTLPFLYVNHEGSAGLSVFRYTEDGKLSFKGTYHALTELTLADSENGPKHIEQQGLMISADGHFLYDMVNGPNVIAVFAIDQKTGAPALVQNQKISAGNWLRSSALSPDGRFLIAASLDPGNVETFRVQENGLLVSGGQVLKQSAAAYVTFVEAE